MSVGPGIGSSIRCVLFDAVGTLIYAQPHVTVVYRQAASDFGLSLGQALIQQRINDAFKRHFGGTTDNRPTTSEEIEKERWRAIVAEVFGSIPSLEAIFARLWHHFAQAENWRTFKDVPGCLNRLHDCGLTLGVASNFDLRLMNICRSLPALKHCQHIFCSSQLGWRKPAIEFFRTIESSLNLKPQQILLVGDDFDADYRGAINAGWQAVLLDRSGTANSPAISSLGELF
jgi:putative hydrolase of the HAD superfamily